MIISALKILSSGKIASLKVLAPAWKLEIRTSSLYQKAKYQVEEKLHILIQYVTIAPEKMTPIATY